MNEQPQSHSLKPVALSPAAASWSFSPLSHHDSSFLPSTLQVHACPNLAACTWVNRSLQLTQMQTDLVDSTQTLLQLFYTELAVRQSASFTAAGSEPATMGVQVSSELVLSS